MRFVDSCVCVCEIICLSARCSSLSSMKSHVFHDTQIPFLSYSHSLSIAVRVLKKKKSKKNATSKNQHLNSKQSTFHLAFGSFCTTTLECNSLSSCSIVLADVGVVDVNNLSCLRCTWKVFVYHHATRPPIQSGSVDVLANVAHSSIHSSLSTF